MLSVDDINELEKIIDRQTAQYNSLLNKYNEVLKLAKENAEASEYCIKELEEENAKLKEALWGKNKSL